jgi:hypothetical protein
VFNGALTMLCSMSVLTAVWPWLVLREEKPLGARGNVTPFFFWLCIRIEAGLAGRIGLVLNELARENDFTKPLEGRPRG